MKYEVTITDPNQIAGITAAREDRNSKLTPQTETVEGEVVTLPIEQHPDYLATDAAYVQFVMEGAAQSYYNNLVR